MFDLARKYGVRSLALASIAAAVALTADPAGAAGYASHGGGGGGYHGGGYHGGGGYRGGYRGWHGGGWGWGVGLGLGIGLGAAYYDPWWPGYYGYGAYPYYADTPAVTVVQPQASPVQAAPASYYYCDNPAGYYPYVQNCSQPWRQVPATPQR